MFRKGRRDQSAKSFVHDSRARVIYVDPFGGRQNFTADVSVGDYRTATGEAVRQLVVYAPRVGLREALSVDTVTGWAQPKPELLLIAYTVAIAGGFTPTSALTIRTWTAREIVHHLALPADKRQTIPSARA